MIRAFCGISCAPQSRYLAKLPKGLTDDEIVEKMKTIEGNMLLQVGTLDEGVPDVEWSRTAIHVKNAKTIIYQGYGHYLPVENPKLVVADIVNYTKNINLFKN